MVTSDAPLATAVGAEILRRGGNAVDAAVATAFALAVVLPEAGNVGGGGFLVARMGGADWSLDFRESAPAKATRDMFLDEEGAPTDRSVTGHLAAGVPGSVSGLWEAHARLGSLPWESLVAPAIALAADGFAVPPSLARAVAADAGRLARFPASAALFLPGGVPLAAGEIWRNPDLAAVLRRIATSGPEGFSTGRTAELIDREMRRGGGRITREDLASYRAIWRAPLVLEYRGHRVVTMALPSSGGVALGILFRLLEPFSLEAAGWSSPECVHLLAEAMRRAFAARNAWLGDPDFVADPTEEILSDAWIAAQRATLSPRAATPSHLVSPSLGDDGGGGTHTTHLSVVDASGNAVALTTTLNNGFGSAVVVEGAGFLLNDEMDDFAAKPGTPNLFGLIQGEANAIEPGKRMLSSMTPAIVLDREGRVALVVGAAGGPRIITSVFQTISRILDHGMPLASAMSGPRMHHQHLPDEILAEPGLLDAAGRRALEDLGHHVRASSVLADVQAIAREGALWVGVSDPRRAGAALGP